MRIATFMDHFEWCMHISSETISTRHADCDFYGSFRMVYAYIVRNHIYTSCGLRLLWIISNGVCIYRQKPYLHVMRIATIRVETLADCIIVRNHIYTSCGLRLYIYSFNSSYIFCQKPYLHVMRIATLRSSSLSETISTRHADCDSPSLTECHATKIVRNHIYTLCGLRQCCQMMQFHNKKRIVGHFNRIYMLYKLKKSHWS